MTAIDYVMIGLGILALITGFKKGLIAQLGVLAGILAGIIACRTLGEDCAQWIEEKELLSSVLDKAPVFITNYAAGVIACVFLFFIGFVVAMIAVTSLRLLMRKMSMGFVDSFLGAIFTFLTWFFVLSIFLNICQAFKTEGSVIDKSKLDDGRVARIVLDFAPKTFGIATAKFFYNGKETKVQQ